MSVRKVYEGMGFNQLAVEMAMVCFPLVLFFLSSAGPGLLQAFFATRGQRLLDRRRSGNTWLIVISDEGYLIYVLIYQVVVEDSHFD